MNSPIPDFVLQSGKDAEPGTSLAADFCFHVNNGKDAGYSWAVTYARYNPDEFPVSFDHETSTTTDGITLTFEDGSLAVLYIANDEIMASVR